MFETENTFCIYSGFTDASNGNLEIKVFVWLIIINRLHPEAATGGVL